jgi:hypothetical protein
MEQKIKLKNNYTSTILKFKLNHKIQHNGAVAALTSNNIPSLENLADDIRKTKSMIYIESDTKPQNKAQQAE